MEGKWANRPPLVLHVIHQLAVGGLENGLVNLVNRMSPERFRHGIVCMTGSSEFAQRLRRADVEIHCMHRGEAPLSTVYLRLFRLFRRLRPCVVHSRNLSGLDALIPAFCAGVPVRIHGEHGRDIDDLRGENRKNQRLKRLFRPLVTHYTAVSADLAGYLMRDIGVPQSKICNICNGVDTEIFRPPRLGDRRKAASDGIAVVAVGRLEPVKDQMCLLKAFATAVQVAPRVMQNATLTIVGDGPLRAALENAVPSSGLEGRVRLLGARGDVAEILRAMDVFVLPSLAEGVSNTLLEAMATGLPVIATRVGGNVELVEDGATGILCEPADHRSLAGHIVRYAEDGAMRLQHGQAARLRAEREFSLDAMVSKYAQLYEDLSATRAEHRVGRGFSPS